MITRQKKVLTVLVLGSLILAWRGYSLFEKYAPNIANAGDPTVVPALTVPAQSSAAQALAETLRRQSEAAKRPWGRNPFEDVAWVVKNQKIEPAAQPVLNQAPPAPEVKFIGTSKSGDQWLAAVQGNIHGVGDVLQDQFKIIRITRHTLTLESQGWTFTYRAGETGATVNPRSKETP